MPAGNFTASNLVETLVEADNIWADNIAKQDYVANVDVVTALSQNQTARVQPFDAASNKEFDVKVWWVNACGITVGANANDCTIGGSELETDAETYAIDMNMHAGFNVKEKRHYTNAIDMEEEVAKGILACDRALSEWFAQQCVAKLETYEGANLTPTLFPTWTYDGVSKDTTIPGNEWTSTLMGKMLLLAKKNKLPNPFLISSNNLFLEIWNAAMRQPNGEGKGDFNMFRALPVYFDVFNLDAVNGSTDKTYLVNRGSVAMAFRNRYPQVPVEYMTQTRYSLPSRNIPGLSFDVVYTNECVSDDIIHKWSFYIKAGVYLNPTGCEAGRTGILTFVNDGGI